VYRVVLVVAAAVLASTLLTVAISYYLSFVVSLINLIQIEQLIFLLRLYLNKQNFR
jgi:hypothetical protein